MPCELGHAPNRQWAKESLGAESHYREIRCHDRRAKPVSLSAGMKGVVVILCEADVPRCCSWGSSGRGKA